MADVEVFFGVTPARFQECRKPRGERLYVSPSQGRSGKPTLTFWSLDGGYFWLDYADGTHFFVDRPGRHVWVLSPPDATLEDTATYLLGPVLGFVLRLRGVVSLHASGVEMDDRVVALAGCPGAGKSTTAAAFARQGLAVRADDLVPILDQDDFFWVPKAAPGICLWPDAVELLFGSPDALPRLTPSWDKRYLDVARRGSCSAQQPLPLAAVYFLEARSDDPRAPFVLPSSGPEGLMALVANTYVNYLSDRAMRAREFELLGRLAARVPLRRVVPSANPAALTALCEVIREDFQKLSASSHALPTLS